MKYFTAGLLVIMHRGRQLAREPPPDESDGTKHLPSNPCDVLLWHYLNEAIQFGRKSVYYNIFVFRVSY